VISFNQARQKYKINPILSHSSLNYQFLMLQIYPKPYDSISHRLQALVYELGVMQQ